MRGMWGSRKKLACARFLEIGPLKHSPHRMRLDGIPECRHVCRLPDYGGDFDIKGCQDCALGLWWARLLRCTVRMPVIAPVFGSFGSGGARRRGLRLAVNRKAAGIGAKRSQHWSPAAPWGMQKTGSPKGASAAPYPGTRRRAGPKTGRRRRPPAPGLGAAGMSAAAVVASSRRASFHFSATRGLCLCGDVLSRARALLRPAHRFAEGSHESNCKQVPSLRPVSKAAGPPQHEARPSAGAGSPAARTWSTSAVERRALGSPALRGARGAT